MVSFPTRLHCLLEIKRELVSSALQSRFGNGEGGAENTERQACS